MPMEASVGAASTGLRPVDKVQTSSTESVQSRGEGGGQSAAGFTPRTNVAMETAIDGMANILSKISGKQMASVEQMPAELKDVINNIIKQSFSLDTTLAQGLGSTAASQRFSVDQLMVFSRMLNQLAVMTEQGAQPEISEDMATLLSKFKSAVEAELGTTFEPVMLTKAAFQLLDTQKPEMLSPNLRQLLITLQGEHNGQPLAQDSGTLNLLGKIINNLMPRGDSVPLAANQDQTFNLGMKNNSTINNQLITTYEAEAQSPTSFGQSAGQTNAQGNAAINIKGQPAAAIGAGDNIELNTPQGNSAQANANSTATQSAGQPARMVNLGQGGQPTALESGNVLANVKDIIEFLGSIS